MSAGHKISQETAKAKESKKIRAIKFIQVRLLYRCLTTIPLKINTVGLLWLFELPECGVCKELILVKEWKSHGSIHTSNEHKSNLFRLPCPRKIPDYPKNFVNNVKNF